MELYMCGFNAHGQLTAHSDQVHLDTLQLVQQAKYIRVWNVFWSSTILQFDDDVFQNGFVDGSCGVRRIHGPHPQNIRGFFGDTSGALGAVTNCGRLYFMTHKDGEFILTPSNSNFKVQHVAVLENGQICVSVSTDIDERLRQQSQSATSSTLHIYGDTDKLRAGKDSLQTYKLQTNVDQLCGSATTFAALTSTGEVLTFGSAFHAAALGRLVSNQQPAHQPSPVTYLGGIGIRKIASGGWITAALSQDQDLYIWGGRVGDPDRIENLPGSGGEDIVHLVDIDNEVDIIDMGVGEKHIVALTKNGDLWATGANRHGQLGSTSATGYFYPQWRKLDAEFANGQVTEVGCGTWSSWAIVEKAT